ncbi:hypothetical protein V8G54_008172 [Vigna mungo]|uniref:Uncharacterized protein n=1 Tax=Vigna mungo TaxID=3915 RepID=A0AAQ3P386_VIGMU
MSYLSFIYYIISKSLTLHFQTSKFHGAGAGAIFHEAGGCFGGGRNLVRKVEDLTCLDFQSEIHRHQHISIRLNNPKSQHRTKGNLVVKKKGKPNTTTKKLENK